MFASTPATYRRNLGNGLIVRWSTVHDTENIAHLADLVFRSKEEEPPNTPLMDEVRRLMSDDHPLMGPHDFGVVEDTHKEGNPIVACTCLWRHEWEYEGIPFQVGRPEIVATDPTYRNRGLVRALFEMVHGRSEAEGHQVQVITGIPYFYRQFGYEFALDLGGRRVTYLSLVPQLKDGTSEPYTLRTATIEDIPFIQECYTRRRAESVVWNRLTEHYWRHQIESWRNTREKGWTIHLQMIIDVEGAPKGYLVTAGRRWSRDLKVWDVQTAAGVNVQAIMPSVLRALRTYGSQAPTRKPDTEPFSEISFVLGRTHPVYDALGQELAPYYEPPYAWYVRVPDLPGFLCLIAPVLEKRLAHSALAGYTGELKLDLYRGGLRMAFEQGRLVTAEPWKIPPYNEEAGAGCPPLVFLQLLFGHRGLDELRHAFPDVWADNRTEALLQALFPARPSFVNPALY